VGARQAVWTNVNLLHSVNRKERHFARVALHREEHYDHASKREVYKHHFVDCVTQYTDTALRSRSLRVPGARCYRIPWTTAT
jgi:hypothetical protein